MLFMQIGEAFTVPEDNFTVRIPALCLAAVAHDFMNSRRFSKRSDRR